MFQLNPEAKKKLLAKGLVVAVEVMYYNTHSHLFNNTRQYTFRGKVCRPLENDQ